MPKFSYVAVDPAGQETRGTIEAPNQAQAIAKIRSQGFFPTAIGVAGGDTPASSGGAGASKNQPPVGTKKPAPKKKSMDINIKMPKFLRARVKQKDLTVLTRQLATLVDAGLPLLRGLHVLERQTPNPTLREALVGMC